MQTPTPAHVTALASSLDFNQRLAYLQMLRAADVRADVFVASARALGFVVSWDLARGTPLLAWMH
ncbi:hypothetical protein LGM80_04315 [Burkholderia multivorans]|uniref:hypothetical protein n=1 Tax=Burkholderia multivorans TaxID=87883 RepID=UPI000D009F30|nr:hypothetical protein [Burkholderia multivorans]MBU9527657.1 hypothetical protein [Burkholderia multivorans]MCA8372573.1 hypothetical protein [Burkholderia multivorans]PRH14823.1 hypothetical protein C6T56_25455 [Burkholderia multivorans]